MAISILNELKKVASDKKAIEALSDILKEQKNIGKLEEFATIIPGIKGRQQMAIARKIGHITVKEEGCGGEIAELPPQNFIEQWWDPRRVKVALKLCYKDLEGSIMQWSLKNGYDAHHLDGNEYLEWMLFFIKEAMEADLVAQVLFGNEHMEESILKEASLKKHYTTIDKGLLPSLQYLRTLESFKDRFIKLDKNDKPKLSEQMTLEKGYAKGILEKLEEMAYKVNATDAQFYCSKSMFRNYISDFSLQGPILESTQRNLQEGIPSSKYMGFPICPIASYDQLVREDFTKTTSGVTKAYAPHILWFTSKSNVMVGLDSPSSLEDLRFEYVGGSDEHFYIKGNYMLDVKIANPLEILAAF